MPKINFNARSICAAIGTGALCATLSLAPIATNLFLSNDVSAVEIPEYFASVSQLRDGVCRKNGDATVLYQNIGKILTATNKEREDNDLIKMAIAIGSLERSPLRDDFVDYRIDGIKKYIPSVSAWSNMTFMDVVKAAKNSQEYLNANANGASSDNVIVYIDHLTAETVANYANQLREVLLNKIPDLQDKPVWELEADSVVDDKGNTWVLHELYYDNIANYISLAKQLPEYDNFYNSHYDDLVILQTKGQNEGSFLNACQTSNSKSDVYAQINGVITAAKHINPNFTIELIDDDEEGEDTNIDETDKPTTSTQSNTIKSSNGDVRVSGAGIKTDYVLNTDTISDDLLKLTGDDFKNSLNQAFYDIYIRDSLNNIITNTGKVQVSIKLPSNMSVNSDFVVYYVPMAANGEYLTDQAQAIKGVKVSSDGWLTFETDHFSVYGIVEYSKGKAPNSGVVARSDGSSAATAGVKIAAGVVSVLTTAGATIVARRQMLRKKNNK